MPPSHLELPLQKYLHNLRRNLFVAIRATCRRAARLPPGERRRAIFLALFACAVVVILLCLYTLYRLAIGAGAGALPFSADRHICPPPSAPKPFATSLLVPSAFVARARHARSTDVHHEFAVVELLRGPAPLALYPVLSLRADTRACVPPAAIVPPGNDVLHGPDGDTKKNTRLASSSSSATHAAADWLVVAASAARAPNRNASLLAPADLLSVTGEITAVWLVPWHALSKEVVYTLTHDPRSATAAWWRAHRAVDEFAPSARRAAAVRRANHAPGAAAAMAPPRTPSSPVDPSEWWLRDGVSIIAACQDRTDSLLRALPSWRATAGVSEIVLVDWGSAAPVADALPRAALADRRVVLVRAQEQTEWVLSRAYNLALRMSGQRVVLKVDCDTELAADFLTAHPLPRDAFYAGDWTQVAPGASNALHANGVMLAFRDDLMALGGFDERITTYGWDDSELATRLARVRAPRPIRYDKLRHLPHAADLRVRNQRVHSVLPPYNRLSPAVEIQRNRLLATKFRLPPWRATATHTQWNIAPQDQRLQRLHGAVNDDSEDGIDDVPGGMARRVVATAANEVAPIAALVSEADALDVAKRAIRLILHRYDVPLLPKSLSLQFYKRLADRVALPERYAEVVVSYRGGCLARLLAHISAELATSAPTEHGGDGETEGGADGAEGGGPGARVAPPSPYIGWRLRGLWHASDAECPCSADRVFQASNEEVLADWVDGGNRLPFDTTHTATGPAPTVDVAQLLARFGENAVAKNVSSEQLKWLGAANGTSGELPTGRVLYGSTTCDGRAQNDNAAMRDLKRRALRALTPAQTITDVRGAFVATLDDDNVLDSTVLSPLSRRDALGPKFASRVEATFNDGASEMAGMARRWTGTGGQPSGVAGRAAALTVASRLSRLASTGNISLASDVKAKVAEVERVAQPLFKGCASSMSDYLETYPELAVIAAALISSRSCSR